MRKAGKINRREIAMKTKLIPCIMCLFCLFYVTNLSAQQANESKSKKENPDQIIQLKTEDQKLSYISGLTTAKVLRKQSFDIDLKIFMLGIQDALNANDLLMGQDEIKETVVLHRERQMEEMRQLKEEKRIYDAKMAEKGREFLEENKKRKDIVTLPTGLQYKVINQGTGNKPGLDSIVEFHYIYTSIDGIEVYNTYKQNKPAITNINNTLKGVNEALKLMRVGSKWKLFVPSDLGFGNRGQSIVGPNATLICEVELLDTKSPSKKGGIN